MKKITLLLFLILAACQPALPPQITALPGEEVVLAIGQTVTITDTELSIVLIDVGDARCPLEIECASSGPVSVTMTVQLGVKPPEEFTLRTFTDNDGSVPEMEFEGMKSRIEYEGYTLQLKGILPFPKQSNSEIKASQYRVAFVLTK